MKNFITFHIVNDIPWSNLNRDDTGTPKRTILGGVERGLLSSQSIKRAVRKDYENRILQLQPDFSVDVPSEGSGNISEQASVRTRYSAEWVVRRAAEIAAEDGVEINKKKATALANSIIKKLVGGEDTIIWLSVEELEALAQVIFEDSDGGTEKDKAILDLFMENGKSGALAIAAFGRMFANASNKNTDAAIAVSPAISTHANLIETDYFIAGDDYGFFQKDKTSKEVKENFEGAGAGHLGVALYTSGIFYRTVTIDINDLIRNWSGITSEFAEDSLRQLVTSILNSLPTGKKNHTAPYTAIPLIIAELQGYREAYSIADPVIAGSDGGFLKASVGVIASQHARVREFNSENYGEAVITGVLAGEITDTPATMEDVVNFAVDAILSAIPPAPVVEEVEDTLAEDAGINDALGEDSESTPETEGELSRSDGYEEPASFVTSENSFE